jgi:hypothetical protein
VALIIVEGVDGSGKTTVIRDLRTQSRTYFWVASSSRRPSTLPALCDALYWLSQASSLPLPIICDRFPLISEPIYGPILRGKSMLEEMNGRNKSKNADLMHQIDRVIYCRPPRAEIIKNLKITESSQLGGVIDNLDRLLFSYDSKMDSLRDQGVYVHRYDYTNPAKLGLDLMFFGRV